MSGSEGSRELELWLDRQHIGVLGVEAGMWSFRYAASWLEQESGFDLCPSLPRPSLPRRTEIIVDTGSQRPVQWFFDNLLPEEAARELIARELTLDQADAFGLLTALGAESAGPWTLRPSGEEVPEPGLQPLSRLVLAARIAAMPRVSLQHDAPKRMSLAGAQHKLAITVRDGLWFEPRGAAASTHIIKPDHPNSDHWPHTAFNEYLCMRLAEAVGLSVPAVEFHRLPQPVYMVTRFDRLRAADGEIKRLPAIDACQLLGVDRSYKYSLATPESLRVLASRCSLPAVTRQALLRWTIFNLLIGNGDAHLKNLSFLSGSKGIRLAPFYDLLSTAIYRPHPKLDRPDWSHAEVSLPVEGLHVFGDLNRQRLATLATATGNAEPAALREAERMIAKLRDALVRLETEWQAAPAERAPNAGEWRLFRTIADGMFAEQARKVGG